MPEFKKIETQEELDEIIKARVAREREKYSDYEQLKKRVKELEEENGSLHTTIDDQTKSSDSINAQVEELKKQVADYERSALKQRVALKTGLPYELASRLVGEDEEAITKDAQSMVELMKPTQQVPPLKSIENESNSENKFYSSLLQNLNTND